MLLTKKSEYALLSFLSRSKHKEPINVDILSKELQISKSFLAKIMQNLAKANLVISHRGVNGGFVLNKPIDELTILEIVFECSDAISSCPNNKAKLCTIWPLLNNLQFKVNDLLAKLTLKDIEHE